MSKPVTPMLLLLPLSVYPLAGDALKGEHERTWPHLKQFAERLRANDIWCGIAPFDLAPKDREVLKADQRGWLEAYNRHFADSRPPEVVLKDIVLYFKQVFYQSLHDTPGLHYWSKGFFREVSHWLDPKKTFSDVIVVPVTAGTIRYYEALMGRLHTSAGRGYEGLTPKVLFVWLDGPGTLPDKYTGSKDIIDVTANFSTFLLHLPPVRDRLVPEEDKLKYDRPPVDMPVASNAIPKEYDPVRNVRPYDSNAQFYWGTSAAEVFLGVSSPEVVPAGSEFVVRFAAYAYGFRQQVMRAFAQEAPDSAQLLDLKTCQWKKGTKVGVRLSARHLRVSNDYQQFTWNGKWEILHFDVQVPPGCEATQAVLKFDVYAFGLPLATLRPEIGIARAEAPAASWQQTLEARVPRTAFASYATKDRSHVMSRVRSLQVYTGVDVFVDCLSIKPGEQWKQKIAAEIQARDIFWLFWSRHAMQSEWVDWEWRTALRKKTLRAIQPHPLEPADVAPAPAELAELQFGSAYESYVSSLRASTLHSMLTRVKKALRFF